MDILAHALWAGAAARAIDRRRPLSRNEVLATVLLGVAPDLIQLLPAVLWSLSQPAPLGIVRDFILATPGSEPDLPAPARFLSHHLHCITHSAVVAGVVTLAAWRIRRAIWPPLAGWWLHIAFDIPTHSAEYYAVPFLYPISDWSVDGIAWHDPWLLAGNYACIAIAYLLLFRQKARPRALPPR